MNDDLIKLVEAYLENVDVVLSIFKTKVGEPAEGSSWKANIPDDGNYLESDISKFHRHGVGIWVYYKDRFVDFDFCDLNFPNPADAHKFITIDVAFLAAFIKSLKVSERWSTYSTLQEDLDNLVNKGIMKKIEYKYYLKSDLDKL